MASSMLKLENGYSDSRGESSELQVTCHCIHCSDSRCTDGPFDIRDFVVKQCFISKVASD